MEEKKWESLKREKEEERRVRREELRLMREEKEERTKVEREERMAMIGLLISIASKLTKDGSN